MPSLLAVDIGIRTGLALFGDDGRLRWYRSHNLGAKSRLRRAVPGIIGDSPDLEWLVLEGGGDLADVWRREAERQGVGVIDTTAEEWRRLLLHPRQQRNGAEAKQHADALARRVIGWSGARKPTSLRHDAAEAILAGLAGAIEVGWLPGVPTALRP